MNKNAVLVGRGGFEPKRETRNPFIFQGFQRFPPNNNPKFGTAFFVFLHDYFLP